MSPRTWKNFISIIKGLCISGKLWSVASMEFNMLYYCFQWKFRFMFENKDTYHFFKRCIYIVKHSVNVCNKNFTCGFIRVGSIDWCSSKSKRPIQNIWGAGCNDALSIGSSVIDSTAWSNCWNFSYSSTVFSHQAPVYA